MGEVRNKTPKSDQPKAEITERIYFFFFFKSTKRKKRIITFFWAKHEMNRKKVCRGSSNCKFIEKKIQRREIVERRVTVRW